MRFIQFSDHHHGEVARGGPGVGINDSYPLAGGSSEINNGASNQDLAVPVQQFPD